MSDGSGFPRNYRPSAVSRCSFGAMAAVAGVCLVGCVLTLPPPKRPAEQVFAVSFLVLLATIAMAGAFAAFSGKVTLYPDRIEIPAMWRRRAFSRSDFSGWRMSQGNIVLVPRDRARRKVTLLYLKKDTVLKEWLDAIPSLDAQEQRKSRDEIAADPEIGSTPEERLAKLHSAQRFAMWARWPVLLVFFWTSAYPHPYVLAIGILAALPGLAVWAASRHQGLFGLGVEANDAHANIGTLFLMLSVALATRAWWDARPVSLGPGLLPALLFGGLLFASVLRADPKLVPNTATRLVLLLTVLPYGWGVGLQANALLDRSAPTTYTAKNLALPGSLRNLVKSGDTVCIDVRPGALHIAWYTLRPCR